jgi:hypothetical protein
MKAILTIITVIIAAIIPPSVYAGPLEQPATATGQKYTVVGKVFQKADDGVLVECKPPSSAGYKKATGVVFLRGHPDFAKLVDGTPIKCTAIEAGTHQYTSVLGATKTVQAFTFASR